MSPKKTTVNRRTLCFHSLDDLLADAQTLEACGAQAQGGWTHGQVVGHIASVMEASIEGFPFALPWPVRVMGRLIRNRAMKKGFPAGIKVPGKARAAFIPSPDLTFDKAVAQLASAVNKAKQRPMTMNSPVFGKLSHDQWVQFHCRHAELHFGFIHPIKQTDA